MDQSFSLTGSGRNVAIFSPSENGKRLTIGFPLAFKLASGMSYDFKEYTFPKEENTSNASTDSKSEAAKLIGEILENPVPASVPGNPLQRLRSNYVPKHCPVGESPSTPEERRHLRLGNIKKKINK